MYKKKINHYNNNNNYNRINTIKSNNNNNDIDINNKSFVFRVQFVFFSHFFFSN